MSSMNFDVVYVLSNVFFPLHLKKNDANAINVLIHSQRIKMCLKKKNVIL